MPIRDGARVGYDGLFLAPGVDSERLGVVPGRKKWTAEVLEMALVERQQNELEDEQSPSVVVVVVVLLLVLVVIAAAAVAVELVLVVVEYYCDDAKWSYWDS